MKAGEAMTTQELKQLNQWIVWQLEERDGKPTKIPKNPKTGGNAQSNNAETWGTYQEAKAALKKYPCAGLGFMFSKDNDVLGVDIDKCRNPESGELTEQAKDILQTLDSYSEVSPSGTGVHILLKGKLPDAGRRSGNLEMYEEGRFFTVTGKVLEGYSRNIEERTEALTLVHRKYIVKLKKQQAERPIKANDMDSQAIIDKALSSSNGWKFKTLYEGNWKGGYPSQSEADMAFCQTLAFWCGGDAGKMDSIFRTSGLMRQKWDERHSADGRTYGQVTLDEAISGCREFYIPQGEYRNKQKAEKPELDIVSFQDVEEEKVDWLQFPYIPLAKLTNLVGFPGEFKTTFALYLTAAQTKEGNNVLYQSAEDGVGDTLKPRLRQFDADFSKVFFINDTTGTLTFKDDRLEKMMEKIRPKLVIFDPFQAFLGGEVDMHRANEVRPLLSRLVTLGNKYKCAIILIMHLSKGDKKHSVYAALGSADIPAAARSILLCGKDPNNPTKGGIVHIKSSLAPAGKTIGFEAGEDGFKLTQKDCSISADIILNQTKEHKEATTKLQQAKELLTQVLGDGQEVLSDFIESQAKEKEISRSTLFRAKDELHVKASRKGTFGSGKWYWSILQDCQESQEYQECHSTIKPLESLGETLDNTGFYQEYHWNSSTGLFWNSSTTSKSIKSSMESLGETLDTSVSDPTVSSIVLFSTHLRVDNSIKDWLAAAEAAPEVEE